MEVTKWLKPSISVSRIGDSASVQAVTRVNAEQASKRTMRRPMTTGHGSVSAIRRKRTRTFCASMSLSGVSAQPQPY
jgi:hypothetical protein